MIFTLLGIVFITTLFVIHFHDYMIFTLLGIVFMITNSGKSTLADRLMEFCGAIEKNGTKQFLDKLPVERARGITVKAQSVALLYRHSKSRQKEEQRERRRREEEEEEEEVYLLNLIDTPGHADFSFEVQRSLAACQGCVLLVDATQGVQAQTVATFFQAFERDLKIVAAVNKIDSHLADVEGTERQMESIFGIERTSRISAKIGLNVEEILDRIIDEIPPPPTQMYNNSNSSRNSKEGVSSSSSSRSSNPTTTIEKVGEKDSEYCRALLIDCDFDRFRGAVSIIQVVNGSLKVGDAIESYESGRKAEVIELGVATPHMTPLKQLNAGNVGYLITSDRDVKAQKVGDTLFNRKERKRENVLPLHGFKMAKPMVFQGIFPSSADDFDKLRESVSRLTLNDASVEVFPEVSAALGPGFRCGFLGLLHAEVFTDRLREEFDSDVVATAPTVPYKLIKMNNNNNSNRKEDNFDENDENVTIITSPLSLEANSGLSRDFRIHERLVDATIIVPTEYTGKVLELCNERRGESIEHSQIDSLRAMLRYKLPLGEIASDFSDELKSRTSGYATFDYELAGWQFADICRLDILVNGEVVDAMATLCHRSKALEIGKKIVKKVQNALPRQMFEIAVQAAASGKIIARETVSAMRKNVLAKCYGGDVSRKKKLLQKQKEGKKRMRRMGNVDIPSDAFAGLLSAK
jgi:translation factor GUF1, mitochondrial